ncbi:MAG: HAD family hydrolase [Planctomycetota bacterium]|nr:HAD family hydrolase [Planctomycetota bacterium]MDP7249937.1 HAD family hydrolase [Planctomycetota bacterium]
MSVETEQIRAICFDFGNTLVEFGPKQVAIQYSALEQALTELFGSCDTSRLKAIRDRQIVAPFSNGFRDNDLRTISEELIRGIYDIEPEESQVETLVQVRYRSFVHAIVLPEGVLSLLNKLSERYRLGFLSNYPCGKSIRDSLQEIGLSRVFEAIVISGEEGYVKPHPKPFESLLSQLQLSAPDCAYVGDNWLADVQGAKRMGMRAILSTQYVPYERFDPEEGDHLPDDRIGHLDELEGLLLN